MPRMFLHLVFALIILSGKLAFISCCFLVLDVLGGRGDSTGSGRLEILSCDLSLRRRAHELKVSSNQSANSSRLALMAGDTMWGLGVHDSRLSPLCVLLSRVTTSMAFTCCLPFMTMNDSVYAVQVQRSIFIRVRFWVLDIRLLS